MLVDSDVRVVKALRAPPPPGLVRLTRRGLIGDSPATLLVAKMGNDIVGAVIAGWDGWRGNIYRLAVQEQNRRKGIGRALVQASEDHLRECGVGRVTALVAFDDKPVGEFWDSAGYLIDNDIGRRVRNL